jgi:hypothetical protein
MLFYLTEMFVRQKKNKSGVIGVRVIDKSSGKYKFKETIGSFADAIIIEQLVKEGELLWINKEFFKILILYLLNFII